jgi:transcription elongation factor Elf1
MNIMKVIKAATDVKAWSLKWTCPHCTSELEIVASDIWYDHQYKGSSWRATCCLCSKQFRIEEEFIPTLVQVDCTKKRYYTPPSSDL